MSDQEITREAVRALIADVFDHHPMPDLQRVETDKGLAVRFVVVSRRLGGILCEYLVEPIAESLLRAYPDKHSAAYSMLTFILMRLPLGIHIGMENVNDTAEVATVNADIEVRSLFFKEGKATKRKQRRARRTEALKKMDARNRWLIAPPKTGPESVVTVETVTGTIGILAGMGKARAEVTPQAVANFIQCSERSVYNALEKCGVTFDRLLNMYPSLKG